MIFLKQITFLVINMLKRLQKVSVLSVGEDQSIFGETYTL